MQPYERQSSFSFISPDKHYPPPFFPRMNPHLISHSDAHCLESMSNPSSDSPAINTERTHGACGAHIPPQPTRNI